MKSIYRTIFLFLFLILSIFGFGQSCIKILERKEINYYYVYKALRLSSKENDTITMLSSKSDPEFKTIILDVNYIYDVKVRTKSAVKISDEKYLFSKHAVTKIGNIQISDKNKLPVIILEYNKVKNCDCK